MKWHHLKRYKWTLTFLSAISVLAIAASNEHATTRTPVKHDPSEELMSTSEPPAAFVSVQLSGGLPFSKDNSRQLGMEKLAEMTAMFRHNDDCPVVPPAWSSAFIVLMMTHTPSEAQIETKERETLALRDRIGPQKWCLLYRVEMQEAYSIYRFMTHQ